MDKNNKEIVDSFISEGLDLIENAEDKIGRLEKDKDQELVNTIFRMFHSIKGSAGFLQFDNIKNVTHEAETLLDIFRSSKSIPDQHEVDLLYQTCDFLKQLIINVEGSLTDKGFEKDAEIIIHGIKESIRNLKTDVEPVKEKKNRTEKKPVPESVPEISIESLITPEMVERFVSESLDGFDQVEKYLLELEKAPYNKDLIKEIFRKVHSFKGNAGFLGFGELEEIAMEMENYLDLVRNEKAAINGKSATLLLNIIDTFGKSLKNIKETGTGPDGVPNKKEIIDSLRILGLSKPKSGIFKPLGEILVEMGAATPEAVEQALENQKRKVGEVLINDANVSPQAVEEALEIQKNLNPLVTDSIQAQYQRKDIRVDTVKLDKLFNLIGELITAEVMVTNNPDLKDKELRNFQKSANYLNKITRELQEIAMTIRMVPLEGLFNKMVRLVRDLSRKAGKEVELIIKGSETEMDRTVIEEISDPLVHIIRNSIDHGIEQPADRERIGKKAAGAIRLEARYEASEIWIIIEDDGGGLNREKILRKARDKGLLSRDTEAMSDEEVWQYIFEPGFSTAEAVTDISGRGVGMDVVKKNIEKIRGHIQIQSTMGKGTRVVLKIPLTLAIMDGINVRVGQSQYSIPVTDIVESFKVRASQITNTEGRNSVIKVREEIIPVIKLYEVFRIKPQNTEITDGIVMVVQSNGKKAGLLLDEIIGNQQIVVKSISSFLGNIRGIRGCSILGSGEVSLIIDIGGLINQCID